MNVLYISAMFDYDTYQKTFTQETKPMHLSLIHIQMCIRDRAYAGAWVIYLCTLRKIDFREKVQRLCEPRTFSYEEAANDFGYTPKTFQEGIVQEIKDYLLEKSENQIVIRRISIYVILSGCCPSR